MEQRDFVRILHFGIIAVTILVGCLGLYGLYSHLQLMSQYDGRHSETDVVR